MTGKRMTEQEMWAQLHPILPAVAAVTPRAVVETYVNVSTGEMDAIPPEEPVYIVGASFNDITCGDWEIEVRYEPRDSA